MKERLVRLTNLGFTAQTIANGIGVSKSAVSQWLSGAKNISEENENKLRAWMEELKQAVAEI